MRRFAGDDSGNMAMLFALAFSLIGVIAAIGVDSAALYHERRMMQAAVDLAALSAAARPDEAQTIAEAVLAEAGFGDATELVVVTGRYEADPGLAPAQRFTPEAEPANAVEVSVRRPGALHFGAGFSQAPMIGAKGLARIEPQVSFSVGSGLASLDSGIANALLGSLLGTNVSLSLVQYAGLANARVDAFDFLDALAFELDVAALTYDDLLDAEASAGDIAAALAQLVGGMERTALTAIALAGDGNDIPLRKLLDLGPLGRLSLDGEGAAIGAGLSVLELISAAAMLADGSHEVGLNLTGGLPGIAQISARLVTGEPAQGSGWFALGESGTVVRTAQVRLRLDIRLLGTLGGHVLQLPVWLDLAHAEAQVVSASCPSEDAPFGAAEVAVLSGALDLAIGAVGDAHLRDFGAPLPVTPAALVDVPLLRVLASAHVALAQAAPVILSFSSDDIESGTRKRARTTGLLASLTQSLLGTLDVDVPVLGGLLGLSLNGVTSLLLGLLGPIVAPLDSVLDALLSALGVGVGEADVRVYGVRCSSPVLVG